MKEVIGIIGITGDLGSQLAQVLYDHDFTVIGCSLSLPDGLSVDEVMQQAAIVHVCAPLSTMQDAIIPDDTLVVLHDSVMTNSLRTRTTYLKGAVAIAHMLMNEANSVVVAHESAQLERLKIHFEILDYTTHTMSVVEHDQLMARSQAPFAILCQVLLPYLFEQQDKGLLTPSGELLASTLHSRQLAWTDETIRSILSNPELEVLINEMTDVIRQAAVAPIGDSRPEKVHKKYSLGSALRKLQLSKH